LLRRPREQATNPHVAIGVRATGPGPISFPTITLNDVSVVVLGCIFSVIDNASVWIRRGRFGLPENEDGAVSDVGFSH
jgi:hypothetical protein